MAALLCVDHCRPTFANRCRRGAVTSSKPQNTTQILGQDEVEARDAHKQSGVLDIRSPDLKHFVRVTLGLLFLGEPAICTQL